jgi:DNA invertase Pin-like site-specific DNA recombinase
VETSNRFARDLMVQEVGFAMLRDLGVTLIAADSPSSFLDDGPTSKLIRQILGAVSEFDKAMIVAKLKGARDRVRRTQGKCEGRKAYAEREGGQELVAMARQLRGNPAGGRPQSLRTIAAELARRGYVTPSGRTYSASAVASMLGESARFDAKL